MKKYHIASGDGKGYYGVGYESYLEATELLKISQRHDPQAHIIEEEYHFTNADRIRAMSDEELLEALHSQIGCGRDFIPCGKVCGGKCECFTDEACRTKILAWLQQPAGEG